MMPLVAWDLCHALGILAAAVLSFLGLGIQPPMASWGSLVAEGAAQLNPIHIHWWLPVFPSALLVTTLALWIGGAGLWLLGLWLSWQLRTHGLL